MNREPHKLKRKRGSKPRPIQGPFTHRSLVASPSVASESRSFPALASRHACPRAFARLLARVGYISSVTFLVNSINPLYSSTVLE
jgi:hypothetical protein